jgi:uncharacterized caspase-like protein
MNVRMIAFLTIFYIFINQLFAQENLGNDIPSKTNPKRAALIIGNGNYSELPLKHTSADAIYIANIIKGLGFKTQVYTNLNLKEMVAAIDSFEKCISDSLELAFVFYTGHGINDKTTGENFLLPLEARIVKQQDIEFEALNIKRIFKGLSKNINGINFLVFDACYKNNLKPEGTSSCLNVISDIPAATLLILSNILGSVSCECYGTSIFNNELIKALNTKGLDIMNIERTIRRNVYQGSEKKQIPWSVSNYTGNCILNDQ